MSKTPEEMAEEYADESPWHLIQDSWTIAYDAYLAGYEAAKQWISVKDRLPEIDQDVLVIKDGLYGLACRKIVERQKLPPPQFNNIEIWEWDYGFEAREGQVTHWQKLPEPPKEEK